MLPTKSNTAIIIPTYNEQKNILKVIKKFILIGKIIVINDNSTDKTNFIIKKKPIIILNNKTNLGYDMSLRKGIDYAISNLHKIKYIITIDADGQHSLDECKKLLKFANNNLIVIGTRNKFNRFSEKIVSLISSYLFKIPDPLCGMKIYKSQYIKNIKNLNIKTDYCGMFFFKLIPKSKIKNVKIRIKNKNKPSSYGEGLKSNLKILKSFFYSIC